MNRFVHLFFAMLAMVCINLHSTAQQPTTAALNAYIDGLHHEDAFNGNILIDDHGKVILTRAVGNADASGAVKLTLDDRFYIGSIAKEFDAVGLLMLEQQGKLALTDPVSKFFPDLPAWAKTVTIDDLLHYTSGLQEINWNVVHNDADNWKELHALQHLDSIPGTQYNYNNNNVFLRRRIIEKVSGMSFPEFLKTQEFPKAGIRNAVIDPTDAEPMMAMSFDAKHKQDSLIAPISGWACLSLDDFLRWSDCIKNFCLIDPTSTRRIVTTRNPDWQTGLGQGEMSGDKLISHVHDGSVLHYRALLFYKANNDRTVLILANQHADVYAMADAFQAILDGSSSTP